uniref:Uncharacterized protein n=1 Tax=Rhipicephalus zambeziensis TaxID=60191 RepID=A0A224Y7A4_9ACAR
MTVGFVPRFTSLCAYAYVPCASVANFVSFLCTGTVILGFHGIYFSVLHIVTQIKELAKCQVLLYTKCAQKTGIRRRDKRANSRLSTSPKRTQHTSTNNQHRARVERAARRTSRIQRINQNFKKPVPHQ